LVFDFFTFSKCVDPSYFFSLIFFLGNQIGLTYLYIPSQCILHHTYADFFFFRSQISSYDDLECLVNGEGHQYRANLKSGTCECPDFVKWRLPCKHMWAAVKKFDFDPTTFPESILRHPRMVLHLELDAVEVEQPNRSWRAADGGDGLGDKENFNPRTYANKQINDKLRLITNLANSCAPKDETRFLSDLDGLANSFSSQMSASTEGFVVRADALREDDLYNVSQSSASTFVQAHSQTQNRSQSRKRRVVGVKTTQARLLVRKKTS